MCFIIFYYQGTEGFEKHMDRLMELTEYMVRRIKQMPDKYYLILEPELVNVCFWYLPTRVRNMPHTAERIKILAEVRTWWVKDILYKNEKNIRGGCKRQNEFVRNLLKINFKKLKSAQLEKDWSHSRVEIFKTKFNTLYMCS